ncbi:helix-turn-helix domain-containing protein [Streptomyces platensis]|uniref:helix-turn-helix domain-containing protein n=1 Tax=Streptomyces platensis TaxID=58346 RepID=UPI00379A7C67
MYRLRIKALRDAATAEGDKTPYAISKRTGLSQSAAYRILSGESQPDLNSLLLLAETYGVTVESLMERTELAEAAA